MLTVYAEYARPRPAFQLLGKLKASEWMFGAAVTFPFAFVDCFSADVREVYERGFDVLARMFAYRQTVQSIEALQLDVARWLTRCEALLPRQMMTTQMHALLHAVEDLREYGPAHGNWAYAAERDHKNHNDRMSGTARPLQNLVQRLQVLRRCVVSCASVGLVAF